MLKKMINHAVVDLTIKPIDPLLIKSGQATVGGVDMSFVRTYRRGDTAEPFIPGSSLKGVIRSYAEKICRSLRETPVPVCLPYLSPGKEQSGEASCGLRIQKIIKRMNISSIPTPDIYRLSCPACRTFGSHYFVGRLKTSDAYLTEEFRGSKKPLLETRDGVAIDRLTGGTAGGAKYDLEVLTKGNFCTRIEINNFERWQLGLLCLVVRDMQEGLIRIGMGTSRGLGRIQASIDRFEVVYFGKPQTHLVGLATSLPEEVKAYGFFEETRHQIPLSTNPPNGLRYTYDLSSTWLEILEPAVKDLITYIGGVPWPQNIDTYLTGDDNAHPSRR